MLEVCPYLFLFFVFLLSSISEAVSPVTLKFNETWKSYCVQSFQSDTVHKMCDGLGVALN